MRLLRASSITALATLTALEGVEVARAQTLVPQVSPPWEISRGTLSRTGVAATIAERWIQVWDVPSGRMTTRFFTGDRLGQIDFSPDGRQVVTRGASDSLVIWDVKRWTRLSVLSEGPSYVSGVAWIDSARLADVVFRKEVRVWDIASRRVVARLATGDAEYGAVAVDDRGAQIVIAGGAPTIRAWDVVTGLERRLDRGDRFAITQLAFAARDTVIGVASNGAVWRWAFDAGTATTVLGPSKFRSFATIVSRDGRRAARQVGWDSVDVVDLSTGRALASFRAPDAVRASLVPLAFGDVDHVLMSHGRDAFVLDVRSAQAEPLPARGAAITSIRFGSSPTRLAAAGASGSWFFDAARGTVMRGSGRAPLDGTTDGSVIVSSNRRNDTLELRDGTTGIVTGVVARDSGVRWSAITPDGNFVVALDYSGAAADLVDRARLRPIARLQGPRPLSGARAFNATGSVFAASLYEGEGIARWEVPTGRPLGKPLKSAGDVLALAFNPQDGTLAAVTQYGSVELWSATGTLLRQISSVERVSAIAFTADGQHLITGSASGNITMWDARTFEPQRQAAAGGSIIGMALAPGDLMATLRSDAVIQLWRSSTIEPIGSLILSADSDAWAFMTAAGGVAISDRGAELLALVAPDRVGAPDSTYLMARRLSPTQIAERLSFATPVHTVASGSRPARSSAAVRAELSIQTGFLDDEPLTTMAFSPDSRLLAVGSVSRTLKLYDATSMLELRTIPWSAATLTGPRTLAFSSDGSRIAAGVGLNSLEIPSVQLWTVADGQKLSGYGREARVRALAFARADSILVSGGEGHLAEWSLVGGSGSDTSFTVDVQALSSSGRFAATVDSEFVISIWATRSGTRLARLSGHRVGPYSAFNQRQKFSVIFDATERYVTSCTLDGEVRVWDWRRGTSVSVTRPVSTGLTGYGSCEQADYNARTGRLAVGAQWWPYVVDARGREQPLTESRGPRSDTLSGSVDVLRQSPDGKTVAIGAWAHNGKNTFVGVVGFWDPRTGRRIVDPTLSIPPVDAVGFLPDGHRVVTVTRYGSALWDLNAARIVAASPRKILSYFHYLAIDPRGTGFAEARDSILVRNDSARVRLGFNWTRVFGLTRDRLAGVAYAPDGATIVAAARGYSGEGQLAAWNTTNGSLLWSLSGGEWAGAPVWTASGGQLLIGERRNTQRSLVLIDVASRTVARRIEMPHDARRIALLDSSRAVIGGEYSISIVDLSGGRVLRTLRPPAEAGNVHDVATRADGLTAVAYDDAQIRLWDLAAGGVRAVLHGHDAAVTSVAFSPDGRRLLSGSSDGSARLWDVESGTEVASLVPVGDSGYVVATPDNYYTASRSALHAVAFRIGARAYHFEQFDLRLNRPDIVLERLGSPDELLRQAMRHAYERRLERMGFTEEMVGAGFHVPDVEVDDAAIPLTTHARVVSLPVRASDSLFALDRVLVTVNGVPLHGAGGIALRRRSLRAWDSTIAIPLSAGRNRIRVSVLNTRGAESLRRQLDVNAVAEPLKADLYVIAIGVSKYTDARFSLQYPSIDADTIVKTFERDRDRFRALHVIRLIDSAVTRERVRGVRDSLRHTRVDDVVVMFVSGHGLLSPNMEYYFATHDVDFAAPQVRGLTFADIEGVLDGIPARRKLLLMDTCHAGEADAPRSVTFAVGQDTVRSLPASQARGFKALSGERGVGWLLGEVFADLRVSSGATVIVAAAATQLAFESPIWRNGVFTHAVRRAIAGGEADSNHDGRIMVSELRDFVTLEVERLTRGLQRPVSRRENLDLDYEIRRP